MNETFSFKRFWTYFKYDLKQMWRNHSKAAIVIGGSIAFLYIIWLLFSLVFFQKWTTPIIEVRVVMFIVAFTILELYQTRTYGYLTEKKAGSAWLMVPASKGEKFVSMMLMTLVVIPILFVAVYFLLDGFLSLVDPTYGKSLISGFTSTYNMMITGMATLNSESPITFSTSAIAFMSIVSFFCNFLYFLLCGICFKKNKIVGALAILFGLSVVMSLVSGLLLPLMMYKAPAFFEEADVMTAADLVVKILNISEVFTCLITVGLGWGIWRRIKTIQH